jgi:hypothetical protein
MDKIIQNSLVWAIFAIIEKSTGKGVTLARTFN